MYAQDMLFRHEYVAAEKYYSQEVRFRPDDTAAHGLLAQALYAQKKYGEALEHLDRAYQLHSAEHPNRELTWMNWEPSYG